VTESLATSLIELIANLCEDGVTRGKNPIVFLRSSNGVLACNESYAKMWKLPSEIASRLPRGPNSRI
jgi:hypothetical protein